MVMEEGMNNLLEGLAFECDDAPPSPSDSEQQQQHKGGGAAPISAAAAFTVTSDVMPDPDPAAPTSAGPASENIKIAQKKMEVEAPRDEAGDYWWKYTSQSAMAVVIACRDDML